MSVFFKIKTRTIPVTAASVESRQNEVSTVRITVPYQFIPDWRDMFLEPYELWSNGKLFVQGVLNEQPEAPVKNDSVTTVSFVGTDELGLLMNQRARADSHYQDQLVIDIINSLLAVVSTTWELGDISTFTNSGTLKTTLDLRSKERLWGQLAEVAKSVPGVFIRYGGINPITTKHKLDVGYFNNLTTYAVQHRNLLSLSVDRSYSESVLEVEAYGDRSGNSKTSLGDALNYPGINSHPDWATYPIQVDALTGAYYVRDLTPGKKGISTVKNFSSTKTKNNLPPDDTDLAEAGFALWQKTVLFLKRNSVLTKYKLKMLSSITPKVNDRIWVKAYASEPVHDMVTGKINYLPVHQVAESFRIIGVECDLAKQYTTVNEITWKEQQVYEYELEISSGDYAEMPDSELELYERLKSSEGYDDPVVAAGIARVITEQFLIHTDPANCAAGTGRSYTFNFTNPIPGATVLTYRILVGSPLITYTITQTPVLAGTVPMILCVKWNGSWPPPSSNYAITVEYFIS